MTIRGVDQNSIRSQYLGRAPLDWGAPLLDMIKFQQEQSRLKEAGAQEQALRQQQELRLMNQAGLEHEIRKQQMEAKNAQAEAMRAQSEAHFQSERDDRGTSRHDVAFAGLNAAVASGNADAIDAHLQNLGRLGYHVEKGDTAPVGGPAAPTPELAPLAQGNEGPGPGAPSPGIAPQGKRQMSSRERALDAQLNSLGGSTLEALSSKKRDYHAIDDGAIPQIDRPRPGRSGIGPTAPGALLPDAPGTPDSPMFDQLPPAKTEAPWAGVRVKDKNGNVVFSMDAAAHAAEQQKAMLGAVGVEGENSRDAEESRAAHIEYAKAQKLMAAGMPREKAYAAARRAYEFELERLGKVKRTGLNGPAVAPAGLTGKQEDKRTALAEGVIKDTETRYGINQINKDLTAGAVTESQVDGKTGLQHVLALTTMIKSAEGGRVSDADKAGAIKALGAIANAERILNQYVGEGQLPPTAISALKAAQAATRESMRIRRQEIARLAAFNVTQHPGMRFNDEAEKKTWGKYAGTRVTGIETEEPTIGPPVPQAGKPGGKPAAKPKSNKELADELIRGM